jgi:hypothetical protein
VPLVLKETDDGGEGMMSSNHHLKKQTNDTKYAILKVTYVCNTIYLVLCQRMDSFCVDVGQTRHRRSTFSQQMSQIV